jgi:5'-3' exonuclease
VLVDEGIAPYYCFDGFHHPMKNVAREEQENKYNSAKKWLDCFYDDARNDRPIDDARRESAMKYLRDITIPDPLVVSYIIEWMGRENIPFECAPFEAEWQLACPDRIGKCCYCRYDDRWRCHNTWSQNCFV